MPELGGYQLTVAMDIFRGRYRESLETPKAIAAGEPLLYRFALPNANHVFLPGPPDHGAGAVELVPALRPQPADLRATSSSGRSPGTTARPRSASTTRPDQASFVELPVVTGG